MMALKDRNMQHLLMILLKKVVVFDGNTCQY